MSIIRFGDQTFNTSACAKEWLKPEHYPECIVEPQYEFDDGYYVYIPNKQYLTHLAELVSKPVNEDSIIDIINKYYTQLNETNIPWLVVRQRSGNPFYFVRICMILMKERIGSFMFKVVRRYLIDLGQPNHHRQKTPFGNILCWMPRSLEPRNEITSELQWWEE